MLRLKPTALILMHTNIFRVVKILCWVCRYQGKGIWAGVAQSVQCLAMGWTVGRSRFDPQQGQRIFPLASESRPALGSTRPPVQWVPVVLSPGLKRGQGVTLITHPHLVPRSRMSNSIPPLHPSALMSCSLTSLALAVDKRDISEKITTEVWLLQEPG
jgi:hypothetical protein